MMESAPDTAGVEEGAEPPVTEPEGDEVPDVLTVLVGRLDLACEELFAVTPYAGDQSTGSTLDGCVDEIVGALRTLRSDADDLRRVMEVARLRRDGGS
ncbi:hypothetical protein GA707_16630 [Nostocoides sp. F2B08]|uniref:hypothetical protein n=1 Tax=Nostocoides sp. F2B08 TaxID=2653936 RepID=UPI001262B016|nr:hypothetical protein [Tetrasphaera sp. F2B08]KAB7741841.1 hypothetical protein GA707_16630 [Tetrasphaera sp. F2B08]